MSKTYKTQACSSWMFKNFKSWKGRLQKDNFVLIIEKNVQISEPYSLNWVSITNSELKEINVL
jgi:hypothetical protein